MTAQAYLDRYFEAAKVVSTTGLPTAFILAHSYLESGKGESLLTKKANNFFGIKAAAGQPSIRFLTKEVINGKTVTIAQNFRTYYSPANGFKAYLNLLSSSRYKNVLNASGYFNKAKELKKAGYFTAGTDYINSLAKTAAIFDSLIKKRPNTSSLPILAITLLGSILVLSNK